MKINRYVKTGLINEELEPDKNTLSAILSDLIQKEWANVDVINGYLVMAQELNNSELNNDINRLENDNKYLTNNINNQKKLIRNYKNSLNVKKNSEKDNNIDKLNKKIKLNQNMISNNKLNLKVLFYYHLIQQ